MKVKMDPRTVSGKLWTLGAPAVAAAVVVASAPGAAAAQERSVTEGAMTWGVKQSFRSYLASPIAHGEITTADGASRTESGTFAFSKASGNISDTGAATLSFGGSVHFTGHEGQLDFTLLNPKLQLNAAGTGTLTVTKKDADGASTNVVIADVSGSKVNVEGDKASVANLDAKLTSAGASVFAFGGRPFYPAGTALDPVSFSVTLAQPAPTSEPTTEPTTPTSEPTAPTSEPTAPTSEPTAPTSEPTAPTSEPTAPTAEPTQPSGEPTAPTAEPTSGETTTGPKVETDYEGGSTSTTYGIFAALGAALLAGGAAFARTRR